MDSERLICVVFGVPPDAPSTERHLLAMANVLVADGRDPSEVEGFVIEAALAYDELIRTIRSGKADHLLMGTEGPSVAELVQTCFSAPAQRAGVSTLEKALQMVVDYVRANGFDGAPGPDR